MRLIIYLNINKFSNFSKLIDFLAVLTTMTKNERLVIYYIGYSWNKEDIMKALRIDKEELERILKKYNLKISKNGIKRAAREKRREYTNNNIIIRHDKKNKECPFICVTVHKQLKTAKKTVYSLSIKDNGKKLRKRSTDLIKLLRDRNEFLKDNNKNKLEQIRKVEFQWFLHHPFTKFTLTWMIQLFPNIKLV